MHVIKFPYCHFLDIYSTEIDDYNITSPLTTRSIIVTQSQSQSIKVSLIRDGIGLEGEESFQLQLSRKKNSGANVFLQANITIVIIDQDGKELTTH